jgi:aminoglycoside phosphotransferase (APT) family kinase protein
LTRLAELHDVSDHVDGRAGVDAALVQGLVAEQFPQWGHLPVIAIEDDGWDKRTYRLGADMTVRLPTHEMYARAVAKEHRWLPVLAAHLPVPIPVPLAMGTPGRGYRFNWSIRRWMDGATAAPDRIHSMDAFAAAIAEFIVALQAIDPSGGPIAGAQSFYRGAPPASSTSARPACEIQPVTSSSRGRSSAAPAVPSFVAPSVKAMAPGRVRAAGPYGRH